LSFGFFVAVSTMIDELIDAVKDAVKKGWNFRNAHYAELEKARLHIHERTKATGKAAPIRDALLLGIMVFGGVVTWVLAANCWRSGRGARWRCL
jgi:hypothetical protein